MMRPGVLVKFLVPCNQKLMSLIKHVKHAHARSFQEARIVRLQVPEEL